MKQKLLLTFALLLTAATGAWADDSGTCGDGVTYSYVESTKTLTISKTGEGTGEMEDYGTINQPWKSYKGSITSVVIGSGVTSIGGYDFSGCENLEQVTIPNSVTTIWPGAFAWCTSMESITIPASVTSIGDHAFYRCTNLASITIPASVTSIGESAFGGCSKLATMTVAVGNTVYDSRNSCNAIIKTSSNTLIAGCKATTFPNDVTSIGNYAFQDCTGLKSITIPASITYIGSDAFYGCTEVTDVYCNADLTKLTWEEVGCDDFKKDGTTIIHVSDADAWYAKFGGKVNGLFRDSSTKPFDWAYDSDTKTLTFSGTEPIPSYSEENRPWKDYVAEVENIIINEGVRSIGDNAFTSCSALTSVTIPASVTSIGESAFKNCTSLTSITIPSGVTSIDDNAFDGCEKLATVTIPSSVTYIGLWTFQNCTSLTSITIPSSVTDISHFAFSSCSNLATVTINGNPYIGFDAFSGIASDAKVTMNLAGHEGATGEYWATFYNENYAFQADENTQVFKVTLAGSTVTLLEVTDKIVDAGTAVVLKSTGTPVMTLTTASSSDTQGNNLVGTYETITNPGNAYVLNNGDEGVGFYKLASTGTIGFGKAYLVASAAARDFLGFDETTGISEKIKVKSEKSGEGGDVIYDIHGRRVNGKPGKGLYIINGKKVVL